MNARALPFHPRVVDGAGPRHPVPFRDGSQRKLLACPRCRQKGLLWYYAPMERGYPTRCIKCGVQAVIRDKNMSLSEIQRAGGFTPTRARKRANGDLDATGLYHWARTVRDVGWQRARAKGLIPNVRTENGTGLFR